MKIVLSVLILFCGKVLLAQHDSIVAADVKLKMYKELLDSTQDYILIDIRTPREWKKGVMKDALTINFFGKTFEEELDTLDKNKPTFIYCATGHRSPSAMRKMKRLGFTEIYNLKGGLRKWKKAGYSVRD